MRTQTYRQITLNHHLDFFICAPLSKEGRSENKESRAVPWLGKSNRADYSLPGAEKMDYGDSAVFTGISPKSERKKLVQSKNAQQLRGPSYICSLNSTKATPCSSSTEKDSRYSGASVGGWVVVAMATRREIHSLYQPTAAELPPLSLSLISASGSLYTYRSLY